MLNTDKVRGVMRARYGSQIPKFLKPSGPLVLELQNPFMVGSAVATPGIPGKLENPIRELQEKEMELARLAILNTTDNKKRLLRLARGLARGTHTVSNGEVISDRKQLVKNVGNTVGGFVKDNATAIGLGADMLSNMFAFDKDGYLGKYGHLQQAGDLAFDLAANAVMAINPLVGGIMKAGGLVSDILTTYGGMGTDSMTKTDAVLGSKLLSLTPVGMINGFAGKKTKEFGINLSTINLIGNSYGGSVSNIMDADSKANKKYGLFSSRSRRKANNLIDEMNILQNIMTGIADDARDMQAMAENDLNYLNYNFNLSGGYDQRYMRAAKSGMKLLDKINFVKLKRITTGIINVDTKEINWEPEVIIFKTGGIIESDYDIIYEIPKVEEFQKGGKTRTLEELIEYAKKENPRFIQRLSESPRGINFVDEEGKNAQGSHLLGYELDEEGNAIVFPSILEMEDGNLKYLSLWDAFDRAIEKKNFLKMTPEEAKLFTESGEDEKGNLFGYKKGWPEFFLKFKKGGKTKEELETPEIEETTQKNLIPEGALHKNKHHMEHTEGLTLKGIPVIDNDGEQLAEIELDEIIFTLEVTKKLEELYKEGTDEAAIEAGKLLVKEILFNTDDRTGLISKCEKGGKL